MKNCLFILLLIPVWLWGAATESSALPDYCYSSYFGESGNSNGQFSFPYAIAIDSKSNTYPVMYVVDSGNNRVQMLDLAGNYISQFGKLGNGDGQFNGPQSLAVDSRGNIYVADTKNARVQKFDRKGQFVSKWGGFVFPKGIAVYNRPDGRADVYVTDYNSRNISKYDENGKFLNTLAAGGLGEGQVSGPNGIAVDSSGHVYVSEMGNKRIQKFSPDGRFLMTFGVKEQFSVPEGLTIDTNGFIFVADSGYDSIQKFSADGRLISVFGSRESTSGRINNPISLAFDNSGSAYVADSGNNRIQKFSGCVFTPTVTPTPVDFKSHSITFFDFEKNLEGTNGYSASAAGGWNGYRRVSPAAVTGDYCAGSFLDSSRISVEKRIFDRMEKKGTIKFSIPAIPYQNNGVQGKAYISNLPLTAPAAFMGGVFTGGNFSVRVRPPHIVVSIPTVKGGLEFTAPFNVWQASPYTVWVSWSMSGADVWIVKLTTGEITHLIKKHPFESGDSPDFSGCKDFWLGSMPAFPGQAFPASLDNLEFYDIAMDGPLENRQNKGQFAFVNTGHSVAYGYVENECDATGDGYRLYMEKYFNSRGSAIYANGSFVNGLKAAYPFTTSFNGAVLGVIANNYAGGAAWNGAGWGEVLSGNTAFLIGPIAINDSSSALSISDFYTRLTVTASVINKFSPKIKQVYVTDPGCKPGPMMYTNVAPYNVTMAAAVEYMKSIGYNSYLLDAYADVRPEFSWCTFRGVHPDAKGNSVMGYYLAEKLYAIFTGKDNGTK